MQEAQEQHNFYKRVTESGEVQVHAFALDGSQDAYIAPDMIGPLTDAERNALQATPLADLQQRAQAGIDSYYEVLYRQSVPNSAIASEYEAAYVMAKRWLDNPVEPAPERIQAVAEGYNITNAQAAAVVVDKWAEAQGVAFDLRGAARLRAKLAIRNAVDADAVAAAEQAGREAMEAVVFSI